MHSHTDLPLISVVIPTAGRADKLRYTLQTILSQQDAAFELIVHDNCTTDGTSELLAQESDPRLRYFRTTERLSMTDNWEAALSKVRGEYVLFLGDDDAILPGGLGYLQECIARYRASAYTWKYAGYNWATKNDEACIGVLPVKGHCRISRTRHV